MSGRIRVHGKQDNKRRQNKDTIRGYSSVSQSISVEGDTNTKHKEKEQSASAYLHLHIVAVIHQQLVTIPHKHLQANETPSKPHWINYKNVIMEWKTKLFVPWCRCDRFIQKKKIHTHTHRWLDRQRWRCIHTFLKDTATVSAASKIFLFLNVTILTVWSKDVFTLSFNLMIIIPFSLHLSNVTAFRTSSRINSPTFSKIILQKHKN